jgi:tetratricopeptide (TPR) repeat protein
MRRLLVAVAVGVLVPSVVTGQTWREVRSPNFTVLTDGSDGRGREVAWQFEQIRTAVLAAFPWARPQLDRPVVIVAARDEKSMRELLPDVVERGGRDLVTVSITSTIQDRHLIVLRSDYKVEDVAGTMNPYWASYWSYSELMLNAAFERALPRWFVRGLSAVLSNSLVKRNDIDFGRPIPWMLESLNQSRVPLPQLLEMRGDDPYLRDDVNRQRFDAQSWGLVHYLLFGRPPDRADAINRISRLLSEGQTSTQAVTQVFGSVGALDDAYREFQRRPITQFARLAVDARINRDAFGLRALQADETATLRAVVHTAFRRPQDARAELAKARPDGSTASAESYAIEGLLLEHETRAPDALAAFTKAVELKSQSFYPYFRVGVELARPGAANDRAGAERNYRQAIALNGAFAPAHMMLANLLATGPMPDTALEPARRAATLEPSDSFARVTMAFVLMRMGQLPAANGQALAGRSLAQNDRDRQQAQQMIDQIAAAMSKAAAPVK